MKLMVDIPEDVYTRLFDNGIQDNEIAVDDVCEMARAIRLGEQLPKGHGRLIDANVLTIKLKAWDINANGIPNYAWKCIREMPTIIEADKRYEAEVITRGKCMMCGKELTEGLFFCKECEDKASNVRKMAESEDCN